MKINYQQGDLFANLPDPSEGKTIFIPHCCNTLGVMGSGFVLPLLKHFPSVDSSYKTTCKIYKDDSLGIVDFHIPAGSNYVVSNMIAQKGVIGPGNPKPIKYAALATCMNKVRDMIRSYNLDPDTKAEIYCPKFGSALAGGSWPLIEELINEIWIDNGIKVTVFYL